MSSFNPQTGMVVDDTDVIRTRVEEDWKAALGQDLQTAASTPAGQLIDSETALVSQKDTEIVYMSNQFNPQTAEGVWQDALAAIYFINRQEAIPTTVTCTVNGLRGTAIPKGSIVKTSSNILLSTTSDIVIPASGTTSVQCITTDPGPIEIGAHTVTIIVTVIPGWDSVDNQDPGVTGTNRESRINFEKRRFDSVANNAHGTLSAIYANLANLDNVIDVVVLENRTWQNKTISGVTLEPKSIYVSIVGGEDTAIAEVLYTKKDGGCGTNGNTEVTYIDPLSPEGRYTYKIERPTPVPFAIQVNIRLTPTTPSDIDVRVANAIYNNFYGLDDMSVRVKIADTVYASRFYVSAINAGVEDLVSIKIAAPKGTSFVDEITLTADEAPQIALADITTVVIT